MKYAYAVKYNGVYYNAGDEVPENKAEKVADTKVEATEKPEKTVKRKKAED